MTYISWAASYEGPSDRAYFEVLLPRIIGELSLQGARSVRIPEFSTIKLGEEDRSVERVAEEICGNRDAFYIAFVHADVGGRGQAQGLANRSVAYCQRARELCDWPPERCVTITPRHETEAWVLADPDAVLAALGYAGLPEELGLPANARAAEGLVDPKDVLEQAVRIATGRRRQRGASQLFAAIAQSQEISALRGSASFREFEERLRTALGSLGVFRP